MTLIALALGCASVAIGGLGVWFSHRDRTRQTVTMSQLIAGAEERSKAQALQAEERTQRLLARMDDRHSPPRQR